MRFDNVFARQVATRGIILGLIALIAGCAGVTPHHDLAVGGAARSAEAHACLDFFASLDAAVRAEDARDGEAARVAGFPHLRVDRFAQAWKSRVDSQEPNGEFARWITHLRANDAAARAAELSNASAAALRPIIETAVSVKDGARPAESEVRRLALAKVNQCAARLMAETTQSVALREALIDTAVVPESYSTVQRVFGLYAFSSIPFTYGVANLHDDIRATFATPVDALPVNGQLVEYSPSPASHQPVDWSTVPSRIAQFTTGDVALNDEAAASLLAAYAPIWQVDVNTDDDRVGALRWAPDGTLQAEGAPATYHYLSRTYLSGRPMLQLNYVIWFPARPSTGLFDVLAGHLDGITWRVTVDAKGTVVATDAMHNCGCYHMVFPGPNLVAKAPSEDWEEPIIAPQMLNLDPRSSSAVIRIASGTHYIERVLVRNANAPKEPGTTYRAVPYEVLRALPRPGGGTRSAFREDGLVAGTERPERWFFWPMGVPSAGAMRQRGHHAIAFVGRRHFDDPDLLDRYFILRANE